MEKDTTVSTDKVPAHSNETWEQTHLGPPSGQFPWTAPEAAVRTPSPPTDAARFVKYLTPSHSATESTLDVSAMLHRLR